MNAATENSKTAIMLASEKGSYHSMVYLLNSGADVNGWNENEKRNLCFKRVSM